VRSHATELNARCHGAEVLEYLLIDGAIQGAALGHWGIGPHDIEDIAVELPAAEHTARREEILCAAAWGDYPPYSRIRKYAGKNNYKEKREIVV
jgi:hypothetical protein